MKKILLATSLAALAAGPALAQTAFTTGPGVSTVTGGTGGNCPLLQATVTVNLSNGNIGAYDCNTNTASIGVGVASTTGKNKVYSLGSAGGGMTETTLSAAPTTSDAGTAATTKSASS